MTQERFKKLCNMSHFQQIFQNARTCGNRESGFGNVPMRNKAARGAAGACNFKIVLCQQ